MRRLRAVTVLELLVAAAISVIIFAAAVQAMALGIDYNEHIRANRDKEETRRHFEEKLTLLLQRIYIDPVNMTNPNTYLVGQDGGEMPPGQTIQPGQLLPPSNAGTATPTSSPQAPTGAQNTPGSGGDSDTIMFTVMGRPLPGNVLATDPSDDFETDNEHYGPQGGIAEYEVSMTPVGDARGQKGVVLREQVPADADATQGGNETIIEPDVTQITFEFFDGLQWEPSWNTFTMTPRQLPAAVKVNYKVNGEAQDRIFIVGLAYTTVSPTNPATISGGTTQ